MEYPYNSRNATTQPNLINTEKVEKKNISKTQNLMAEWCQCLTLILLYVTSYKCKPTAQPADIYIYI